MSLRERRVAFAVLAAAFIGASISLCAAEPGQVLFIPPEFYPGDAVEARIALEEGALPAGFSLESLGIGSADGTVLIKKIAVEGSASRKWLSIRFSSYAPGKNYLPAFSAGGRVFGPIPIETRSIFAAEGEKFRSYRPQRVLPGTLGFIYVSGAVFVIGLILLYSALAFGYPFFRRLLASYLARQPGRSFLKKAEELGACIAALPQREYYARLAAAAREYFCARIDPAFAAFTAREMVSISVGVLREDAELLSRVFRRAELVRFGGEDSDEEERRQDLLALRRIAEKIEEGFG